MIEKEKIAGAIAIIIEKILTPVLYMYIDETVEFICFCDSGTADEDFRRTERAVFDEFGLSCEIVDIRQFDENDRLEITATAEMVYSANEFTTMLFEHAMYADAERIMHEKQDVLKRKAETGTYYTN